MRNGSLRTGERLLIRLHFCDKIRHAPEFAMFPVMIRPFLLWSFLMTQTAVWSSETRFQRL
jgi:hypothetical protein